MKTLFLLFIVCTINPAMAYVDPGTGSILISAIVGFFAGVVFFIKKYYYKILSFFQNKNAPKKDQ